MKNYLILLSFFVVTALAAPQQDCSKITNPNLQKECNNLNALVAQRQQAFMQSTQGVISGQSKTILNQLPRIQTTVTPNPQPFRQIPTTQYPPAATDAPKLPPSQQQQVEQQLRKANRIYY